MDKINQIINGINRLINGWGGAGLGPESAAGGGGGDTSSPRNNWLFLVSKTINQRPQSGEIIENLSFHQDWSGSSFLKVLQGFTTATRNNISDRFGYRPIPFYFSKHLRTSICIFCECLSVATEPQNLWFVPNSLSSFLNCLLYFSKLYQRDPN